MSVREFGKRRLKIKRKVILSNENNELRIDESGVRGTPCIKEDSYTDKENLFVWLFSLINRKLLLCSVTSSQSAGFAFLFGRKK